MKTAANLSEQSTKRSNLQNRIKETITFTKSVLFLTKKIFML